MVEVSGRMHSHLAPMRGIRQAVLEIKAADPHTALTERAVRRMVAEGTIPAVRVGRKQLINLDVLYAYLTNGSAAAAEDTTNTAGIRPVRE
ncbi:MAG TPA: excisionase family DNA-binding protein [Candidatus Ornithomonoglobus merdipullorum]|uniref:Excisionase family DNA-binding protein n=1 Tax=Candidatus Ornithomonoglobus merdipullorum TaxID=2840895 RepID=A0A9D1MCP4_9FIRM|nr:excisionase family DNA-binding protein [Candidatus Ornithomonoglobus merdipullorum]